MSLKILVTKRWDRSHFLEDASGYDITCNMIGSTRWQFTKLEQVGRTKGKSTYGRYGYTPNNNNVEAAIVKILNDIRDDEFSSLQVK